MPYLGRKGRSRKNTHQAVHEVTKPRRRVLWRVIVTYSAIYIHKDGKINPVTVRSLQPLPKFRTFQGRKLTRTQYTATRRMAVIVARSTKKGSKKKSVVDDELEELEELEGLDDLDDLEDDEDDEDDDEPDDEDDEDESDEEDEFDGMNKTELKAAAKEAGIKGYGKMGVDDLREALRNAEDEEEEDDEDEEDEDDEEEEEEEAPKPKRSKSAKSKTSAKPSRSRTTDGKVGVAEVAEAAGIDGRKLRILLRKEGIDKDPDTGRYEWSSLKNKEVVRILKLVKSGAADRASRESLDKLKSSKKKDTGAKRTKSSGTTSKKKRTRS